MRGVEGSGTRIQEVADLTIIQSSVIVEVKPPEDRIGIKVSCVAAGSLGELNHVRTENRTAVVLVQGLEGLESGEVIAPLQTFLVVFQAVEGLNLVEHEVRKDGLNVSGKIIVLANVDLSAREAVLSGALVRLRQHHGLELPVVQSLVAAAVVLFDEKFHFLVAHELSVLPQEILYFEGV